MSKRVVVLGAGFGGLELACVLSEDLGPQAHVTLIDRADAFLFGYSKLDVLFGLRPLDALRMPYADFAKPGVTLLHETVVEIDAANRRVKTDARTHDADVLVIALGADVDVDATPGFAEHGEEFYSLPGALEAREALDGFTGGAVVLGVAGFPIKCPPAPSEAALLLDDHLRQRGVEASITFAIPMPRPVPPSPEASESLTAELGRRGITLITENPPVAVGADSVTLKDGTRLDCDLFLGVPKHRAPDVVVAAGLTENGYVPVDPATLRTAHDGVYAIGDVAELGVPMAGAFAQTAGAALARRIAAEVRGEEPAPHVPSGGCYVEFGDGRVGRIDIEIVDGERRGTFSGPSEELRADKERFGSSRRARWFGAA